MYLLIRVVILAILFAPAFIVLFNKKLRNRVIEKLKYYDSRKVKRGFTWILIAVAIFVLAIFYPFESSFIRFDTVEQSVDYSMYNFNLLEKIGSEAYFVEDEDTVFIVNAKGNTYRYTSATKYEDGYGYCGHNVSVELNTHPPIFISTSDFEGAAIISTVYNKNTDKTCYILCLFDDEFPDEPKEIYDQSNIRMSVFRNDDEILPDTYYSIEEGAPEDRFDFVLDGKFFELDLYK